MSLSTWGAVEPSTAEAREIASWLLGEATAHRMPPVASSEPAFESVRLTVCPEESWQWRVWCNFLQCAPSTLRGECVTARGVCRGVHVILIGLNPAAWAQDGAQ